jgi:HEAT repeat protein
MARGQDPAATDAPAVPAGTSVESLFADFLHYAKIGRFTEADAYAKALLEHSDLDPVKLLEVSRRDRTSVRTLLILIENSTIGERAARVLELIQQGEREQRHDPALIQENIERLGGDPQQEWVALKNLRLAGEYAIPPMVQTLLDPARRALWPRVVSALPHVGKDALNPLVVCLPAKDDDVRLNLIRALGEIGYPQAVPYLRRLTVDATMPPATQRAAQAAIDRIEELLGRPVDGEPSELFFALGDAYYAEAEDVTADPRLSNANVWYWDAATQAVRPTVVPQRLFGPIMSMRCGEEALRLENDHVESIALWLASNIRREARLGMNVESGNPDEMGEPDPTRPAAFPRALYFTQAAGPRYAHRVLRRAIADADASVALGAIEALRITAGESSLIGTEDEKQPLVAALQFPDIVVRVRAALALGAALPKTQFDGSRHVVPVLGQALVQSGRRHLLVVDPDPDGRNRVMGALRAGGDADVIGEGSFYQALQRARVEFPTVTAVFIAGDITEPDASTALAELRHEFAFAQTPVVILAKPDQSLLAEELASLDPYTGHAASALPAETLLERVTEIRTRTGQADLDPTLALTLAIQSAQTLRGVAADGRTVFDVGVAEPQLIAALSSPSEDLQVRCASVLALLGTDPSQRSLARLALSTSNSTSLRVAAFGALAESARNHGNKLESAQIDSLVQVARDDADLVIRTAASEALGAVNLATNQASEIIRRYYGG